MIHSPRATGLRRRDVLVGATLAVAGLAPLTAGCTPKPAPEPPDPLAALATRATADAELARATGAAHPDLAAAATLVADNRAQHAAAIGAEMHRVRPVTTTTPTGTSAAPTTPPVPPQSKDAASALVNAMRQAEREAAALVPGLPRYRAGLIGSVAAGCAALGEVVAS